MVRTAIKKVRIAISKSQKSIQMHFEDPYLIITRTNDSQN